MDFSGPFAMPEILLQCCHGEIIVILLATGYLGEHQTIQPGPVSKGPGAVAVPNCLAHPLLSLSLSSTPPPIREAAFILVHKDTIDSHLHEVAGIYGSFLLLTLKSVASHGQSCPLPQMQLKFKQLSEEKPLNTYFY